MFRSILMTICTGLAGVLLTATSWAGADVVVTVAGGAADTAVELTAPDGTTLEATDDDGDGVVVLSPERAGTYEITLRFGDSTEKRRLDVPESGQVSVLVTPRTAGEKVRITYSGANERILVTARRREEDIQTTPIAITAFPAEAIEERSMKNLSDVGDFTPNMDFSNAGVLGGSSSEATVYIRGIGQISTTLFSDPGVGIYVDGVYLARAQGAVLELVDLERVEVLRGPQGTLFGKNTMGGAVNLITKKPDGDFAGYGELAAGNFDRLDGRFNINVPFSERAFGSLSLSSSNNGGITESLATNEDYYDDNEDSGRLALRFLPKDNLTIDWTFDATRERESAVDTVLISIDNTIPILEFYNRVVTAAGLPAYDEAFISGNFFQSYSSEDNFSNGDVFGTALSFNWNVDSFNFRSISSLRDLEYDVSHDLDGSPIRYAYRPTLTNQQQFTQEFQLLGSRPKLDWVVGTLFFTEESSEDSHGELLAGLFQALEAAPGPIHAPPGVPAFLCNPGPPPPGLPCFGAAGNPFNFAFFTADPGQRGRDDLKTDSYAVFGEGTWATGEKLSLTFGVRFTREEKEFLLQETAGPTSPNPSFSLFNSDEWDAVTPRFSIAYQATDAVFIYGSIARGFKSGGFNGLRGGATETLLLPFDPEKLWTYEIGFKSDLFDNKLRLNGALFFNDYTDLQLTASLSVGGMPSTVIENAGQSEIQGFELELQAQPSRSFLLNVGIGYTDAEFTDLDEFVQAVTLDGTIPKTPEWSVVVSPQYTFTLAKGGAVILRGDYSYKSRFFNDVANTETVAQPAFDLVNARLTWVPASGHFEVSAFGTNLFNEEYLEHGINPAAFGPAIAIAGRPREYGLSARFRF